MEQDEATKRATSDEGKLPQLENEDEDERSHSASGMSYCTFAVTGAATSFQPIFICHDCFHKDDCGGDSDTPAAPLCICQACADICHGSHGNDHDVEYIGMGPSYCDCDHVGKCLISQKSQVQAEKLLGTLPGKPLNSTVDENSQAETTSCSPKDAETGPLQEAFDVPFLQNTAISAELMEQAKELILHSKETFWIDKQAAAASHSDEPFCALEQLAWKIFEHHLQHYESLLSTFEDGGAEWWVQVKDPSSSSGKDGAVDLHYDKDEALAEIFGLGSFPKLSTVTYLSAPTSSQPFNPTIVFDHRYSQGEDDLINTMLVSRPRLGKHLVFDGELLHGAPAHNELRDIPSDHSMTADLATIDNTSENGDSKLTTNEVRVTFLVNVWKRKPAKVQPLPNEIRDVLLGKTQPSLLQHLESDQIAMIKKEIPMVDLETDEDLPEQVRHRIELPFVSKGATWEDQLMKNDESLDDDKTSDDEDGDEGGGLVVITCPPPPSADCADDTMLVKFGAGLQAYLDYPQRESSPEDEKMEMQHETGYV
jgi:hypothetical protein